MNRVNFETTCSVILPTYNEAGNIIQLVNDIMKVGYNKHLFEIIVVDDNSPDKTYDLVSNAFEKYSNVKAIKRTNNRGLGNSILEGIKTAKNDRIIVMDSDLTHDPTDIPKLLHVAEIYDIVSGSRFCSGGKMTDTLHYYTSLFYNFFLRTILGTQVQDNLGGFFTARKNQVLQLPVEYIFRGYGEYYFRFLYVANVCGLSIVEIPSNYLSRGKGKSKSNWIKMFVTYTLAAIHLKFKTPNFKKKHRP